MTVKVCPAIVIVPVRSPASVVVATVKETVPDPVPDAPLTTTSQSILAFALHEQVGADAVTVTLPLPPAATNSCEVGESENVHGGGGGGGGGGAAACDSVKVWPPTAIVALRARPGFASTLYATEPLPLPDAPLVTINHDAFDSALHAQVPADALTANDPDVAVSATFCDVGAIVNVHGGGAGAAACVTVNG